MIGKSLQTRGVMNHKKLILSLLSSLLALCFLLACLFYFCTYYKAIGVEKYFVSSDEVRVEQTHDWYYFDGKGTEKALVFYPGARVESKAYAPLMYRLAQEGVDCYLMIMPFHMAIFGVNAADKVVGDSHESWYLGGHSMGGAMAASYAGGTDKDIDGLVLLAAYSASDLKARGVPALSVYGDRDGVLNGEKVNSGREYFSDYTEKVISGGNHAQFGCYGKQEGDRSAAISDEEQLALTVQYILEFVQ